MPYLGSTVFFVVLAATLSLALTGWLLLTRALTPRFVVAARDAWARRPLSTLLLGAVLGAGATLVGVVLLKTGLPILRLGGGLLLGALLLASLAGLTGLAELVGARLPGRHDDASPWRRTLRGALVLEASFVTPLLGWLAWLPLALLGGLGASAQAAGARLAQRLSGAPEPADAQA
ncbi:MAG TPA: hypothetical protein RMH85_15610 [Polyangiaceae bacterium LLY-WYZ-15_(1-7)]|nr:hypothetical protein [Sandaracinus sp.]MBJ72483.1 hypothetical protein [Sandaracinus sp.]HJL04830.1 hypothetical protein [Polyangiaceae bacterium LLY-WYZ-15_(1-7)]HJL09927.1 hypothetical protein [Polyangiaceae bacterium LLY-WYZ-15_(1-7)]HJL34444.1 hypothetical protein [Polyangiaceae bacterium LLY-WYZ-15_(1-7)]